VDQGLLIVGGEEEAARVPILEVLQQVVREPPREFDVRVPPAGGHQGHQRVDQVGMVVEEGPVAQPPVPPHGVQAPFRNQPRAQEIGGAAGRLQPVAAPAAHRGSGEAGHGHAVPAGKYFVVGGGRRAGCPSRQQLAASRCQQARGLLRRERQPLDHRPPGIGAVQDPAAFEVGGAVEPVQGSMTRYSSSSSRRRTSLRRHR
jgi:hypothetical protein